PKLPDPIKFLVENPSVPRCKSWYETVAS
ncbi:hypothetical protein A2U01_0100162, partial [Trifolium medium]|nr:hypothetical protein [Trifolium medium]